MAAAAFMAVNVPDGLGKNSAGFALSYARNTNHSGFRVPLYWKTCPLNTPTRNTIFYWFFNFCWVMVYVSFWTSTFSFRLLDFRFDYRYFNTDIIHVAYVCEICSQYTSPTRTFCISILGVVDGISSHKWTVESITDAALGLGIASSLWWIYFDMVDGFEINALVFSNESSLAVNAIS